MSHSVQMPALGESVTEGTVTRWLKTVGDQVEVDEPLLEVSTDKVDTEIPSPYGGVLEKILVGEDETAAVGADLGVIGDGSGADAGGDATAGEAGGAAEWRANRSRSPRPCRRRGAHRRPSRRPTPRRRARSRRPAPAGRRAAEPSVTLPEMGESVTEGTVTRWLKAVGDEVARRRAAGRDLHRQGRHRGAVPGRRHAAGDLGRRGRDRSRSAASSASSATRRPRRAAGARSGGAPEPQQKPDSGTAPAAAAAQAAPSAPAAPPPRRHRRPGGASAPSAPSAPSGAGSALPPAPVPEGTYVTPVIRKLAADSGVDLVDGARAPASAAGSGARTSWPPRTPPRPRPRRRAARRSRACRTVGTSAAPAPAGSSVAKPDEAATALIGTTARRLPRIRQSIAKNMRFGLDTAAQLTTVMEVDVTRVAAAAGEGEDGVRRRARACQPLVPAVLRQGRDRGAQGVPGGQLLAVRGPQGDHLPRQGPPGHRRRHPARADRAR